MTPPPQPQFQNSPFTFHHSSHREAHSPLISPPQHATPFLVPENAPTPEDAPRSPFAGCLILIVMAVVVLVLIASAGYSVKKQTDAYKTFTETEPRPAPIADLTNHEPELNSLMNRLRHFDHEIENDRPAQIALTPQEINYAIAHFDLLKSFRGQLSVNTITDSQITGIVHYPFNSTKNLPGFVRSALKIEARDNNMNGTFTGNLLLTDGKLILNLTSITPSRGELPDELFANMSRQMISGALEQQLKDDPENPPPLLTKLKKITSLSLHEGSLILAYAPGATPPSIKQEADAMATKAKHLVALGAVIFILIMILAFILLSRHQKAKRAAS